MRPCASSHCWACGNDSSPTGFHTLCDHPKVHASPNTDNGDHNGGIRFNPGVLFQARNSASPGARPADWPFVQVIWRMFTQTSALTLLGGRHTVVLGRYFRNTSQDAALIVWR